ncbi:MAG: hypothetical protein AAB781_00545 [Patescibacteria group bacterium]
MKIIGIAGILEFPKKSEGRLWMNFRNAFNRHIPDAEFVVEKLFYFPWQKTKILNFSESIINKYDTGEDIIFVGYSFGGIIATAISERFKMSHVRMIVTVMTPHKIKIFSRMLGYSKEVPVPIISFGALFDIIVPCFITKHPRSRLHIQLLSDHLILFLFSCRPAERIARVTKTWIDLN